VKVPFDLAAAEKLGEWRDGFEWPLDHDSIYGPTMAFVRRVIGGLDRFPEGETRDVLTVCLPRMIASTVTLIETALWLEAAESRGIELIGGPASVYRLKGLPVPQDLAFTAASEAKVVALNFEYLRRVARVKSWTPWRRLPAALTAPEAVAITHNPLLRAEASRRAVGYRHASAMLTLDRMGELPEDRLDHLLSVVRAELGAVGGLSEGRRLIISDLITEICRPHCEEAQTLVSAARRIRRLPRALWGGSGGFRPARAIRIEARRRGVPVTGFDHSGSAGMIAEREALVLAELCVSDRFVAPTDKSVEMIEAGEPDLLMPLSGEARIEAGDGDPSMAWRLPPADGRAERPKPRVLYISGAFVGFRQRVPPRIPDVVKLDWQIRLIQTLQAMPIDLRTQMHPGGILQGRPHPAAAFGTPSGSNFEQAAPWADVMVFDVVQSTTFTLALTTDRPIVLIDHGMNRFTPAMRSLLARRCRILKVGRDDRNRVSVDAGAMAQAIQEAARDRPDPAIFRSLFAGRYA